MLNRITISRVSRVHQLPFTRASVEQGTVFLRADPHTLAPVYSLFTTEWLKTRESFNLEPDVNIHSVFHSLFRPILLLVMSAYPMGSLRHGLSLLHNSIYTENLISFRWRKSPAFCKQSSVWLCSLNFYNTFRMKCCAFILHIYPKLHFEAL